MDCASGQVFRGCIAVRIANVTVGPGSLEIDPRSGVTMKRFSEVFRMLRQRAQKSRYRVAQYSGIDQSYILRLETGEKANPSRDVVLMLALALAHDSDSVGIHDVEELLMAAGYVPFRRRGKPLHPAA